jgi:hypothetical protein
LKAESAKPIIVAAASFCPIRANSEARAANEFPTRKKLPESY